MAAQNEQTRLDFEQQVMNGSLREARMMLETLRASTHYSPEEKAFREAFLMHARPQLGEECPAATTDTAEPETTDTEAEHGAGTEQPTKILVEVEIRLPVGVKTAAADVKVTVTEHE